MAKRIFMCVLALLCAGIISAQDAVEGLWKSIDEKDGKVTAAWKIYAKDNALFGEIITVPGQSDATLASECKGPYKGFPISGDISAKPVVGLPFIYGLKMRSAGNWDTGNIIDPKDGKLYKCKITFHKADGKKYKTDILEMRGEIGLGIGRSQFWEKTTDDEIETFRK
jgi:uncharacterized protein (DUF2147 family)